MTQFDDFDLRIRRDDGTYSAELIDSDLGDAVESFAFTKSEDQLKVLLLTMGRTRSGTRSAASSQQRRAAEDMGAYLFDTVFSGSIREKLRVALAEAKRSTRGVRFRLRLENDPALLDLPWEFMFDTDRSQFLSISPWTPIVRYQPTSEPASPLPFTPPLRILVAISGAIPPGSGELDVDGEWRLLHDDALGESVRRGLVALDRVSGSMDAISNALRTAEYHVFHYIGHSGFDDGNGEGLLMLEGPNQSLLPRTGNDLSMILGPHRTLRLAVFNSCEGARVSARDPFAGVAQSLLQKGVPAVVAMQFEITDNAARRFSQSFYAAVARGDPIDSSVGAARQLIFGASNDVEWGTPVLFLQTKDGVVFDRQALGPDEQQTLRRHAGWYRMAREHLDAERWSEAIELLEWIEAERADYLSTSLLLDQARGHVESEPDERSRDSDERDDIDASPAASQSEATPIHPTDAARQQWVVYLIAAILIVVVVIVLIGLFANS